MNEPKTTFEKLADARESREKAVSEFAKAMEELGASMRRAVESINTAILRANAMQYDTDIEDCPWGWKSELRYQFGRLKCRFGFHDWVWE